MSTALSRTGSTSPLGKLTAELPKVRISEETHEGAERQAREAGLSLSEWVRTLVEIRVHGLSMMTKVQADRLAVVAGKLEVSGE